MCSKANSICFAHQSLCSPQISTLLKAIRRGYLKGCPNLTKHGVTYLNASPASTKGHMKRPCQGIRSTRGNIALTIPNIIPIAHAPSLHDSDTSHASHQSDPQPTNIIEPNEDTAAKVFCFAAFADKRTGVLYSNLTGMFPFMSLEVNVCFLVVYHYKTNAILALPIKNFTDECILAAYKQQFKLLESKGHKIKLNVMDNQASKVIKEYLTLQRCENLLVEPNNHQVNASERAIQTFKAHFISALATTDSNFPLQLWDRLTPQVKHTLNILRSSRLDPTKSAYEAIHGPYDWDHFLLAPPGCKAVIYKFPEAWGSWASRGTDAWCVGPSMDHYQCNHFFVTETRAYCIFGSAELFPQHCQLPFLLWNKHSQEVIDKLITTIREMPPEKQTKVVTLV